jgi:hypothetical protein
MDKKPKLLEHDIQSQILDWLGFTRIFHRRTNTGGAQLTGGYHVRFGRKGDADIIACYKGQFVAIEVKGEKGVQSQEQAIYQSDLEAAGGRYILARSLDDVKKGLGVS